VALRCSKDDKSVTAYQPKSNICGQHVIKLKRLLRVNCSNNTENIIKQQSAEDKKSIYENAGKK